MALAVRITGVGCALPAQTLTNQDLERLVETSDEWIVERSGIHERRIAGPLETSSTLGAEAARRAIASAALTPADIDLVITATSTPDGMFPATATHIQHAIGAHGAASFDVNAACAGFLMALATGAQFVHAGSARHVLVVGAEVMSRIIDWSDRTTCVLFGDGAGAVVLEAAPAGEPGGFHAFVAHSDGAQAKLLYANGPASARPHGVIEEARLVMDGRAIFRRAVEDMARASQDALSEAGLRVEDIALCVPHQANARIIGAVARALGLPEERVFVNLERYGNTSSATIPIALTEATVAGRLHAGDEILLTAFGGGLTWGALALQWSGVRVPPVNADPASGSALADLSAAR